MYRNAEFMHWLRTRMAKRVRIRARPSLTETISWLRLNYTESYWFSFSIHIFESCQEANIPYSINHWEEISHWANSVQSPKPQSCQGVAGWKEIAILAFHSGLRRFQPSLYTYAVAWCIVFLPSCVSAAGNMEPWDAVVAFPNFTQNFIIFLPRTPWGPVLGSPLSIVLLW